jgi:phosphoglycerol transferase
VLESLRPRRLPRPSPSTLFLSALLLVLAYLALRNTGQYPSVFGDEWSYSTYTRLTSFRDAPVPSYLYYTAYRLTSSCGDGFLECARLLNAVFLVGAAPFIYLIARQYMARRLAMVVAVLAVLMPCNTYTAYFMPEAMYYWGFWLFSWSVLRARGRATPRSVALSAAQLGLLAMVKVHALFLLPGYLVYLVYCAFARRAESGNGGWLRQALTLVAVALLAAAAARFAVGYLYAGRNGLYLLGTVYANQAQTRPAVSELIKLALFNLQGHLLTLALLFGLPLAAAALQCISRRQRGVEAPGSGTLLAYAALTLPALVAMTAIFTAMVAGAGTESNLRLHMRYYHFALPLLLILAGAQLMPSRPGPGWRRKLLVGAPLLLLMATAYFTLPSAYTANHIDSPTLFGMSSDDTAYPLLAALGALSVLAWIVRGRWGARLFMFVYVPALLAVGGTIVNIHARHSQRADAYVKAGIYAHQYLSDKEAAHLTVVGGDIISLFKTRYFLDNVGTEVLQLAPGQAIDRAKLPYPNGWLLVVGDYPLPDGAVRHSGQREYTLARLKQPGSRRHQFSDIEDDGLHSSGLSAIEDWGRWSEGGTVTLTFDQPLPRQLLLRLDVAGYGPNTGLDFQVSAGGQTLPLRAAARHELRELRFDTDGSVNAIVIKVPQPTSPKQMGAGDDQRQLGLGLYSLEVIDAAAKP